MGCRIWQDYHRTAQSAKRTNVKRESRVWYTGIIACIVTHRRRRGARMAPGVIGGCVVAHRRHRIVGQSLAVAPEGGDEAQRQSPPCDDTPNARAGGDRPWPMNRAA